MTFRPLSPKHASRMQYLGDERRRTSTAAEAEFERILNELNDGVLRGRFMREWVCGNKWVVDFFFPEIRLAVEIDGEYHGSLAQAIRDAERELGIERLMVTFVRFTNAEVFGDRDALVGKLRDAWRKAQQSFKRASRVSKRSTDKLTAMPSRPRSSRLKTTGTAFAGGWTSMEQGNSKIGDKVQKQYIDEGFGGSRNAIRAMNRQLFADIKNRNKVK